jgi:pimeloyl-ACP methyl ester carboxylesterase
MVIVGDRDIVSIEHTTTMFQALKEARLAVVPNASHLLLHEHPGQVTTLVQEFLDEAHYNH